MLSGKIDLAVHSLKDMPMIGHPDLPIAAFFKRGDPRDALIYPENGESEIKILGTSSARRRLQAKSFSPTPSAVLCGEISTLDLINWIEVNILR